MRSSEPAPLIEEAVVKAVRDGDEQAFTAIVERYRRQLQVHCYRMLGSLDDSEDLVQETLLRAWRGRANFEGRSLLRTWLYRIATNACLSALEAIAHTLVYDATIVGDRSLPTALARAVATPTLVIAGGASAPFMRVTAQALADALPNGQVQILEGQTHDIQPSAVAPVLQAFLAQ